MQRNNLQLELFEIPPVMRFKKRKSIPPQQRDRDSYGRLVSDQQIDTQNVAEIERRRQIAISATIRNLQQEIIDLKRKIREYENTNSKAFRKRKTTDGRQSRRS